MKTAVITDNIQFREVQQFRQSWLWVLLVFSGLTSIILPTVLLIADKKKDNEAFWVIGMIVLLQAINLTLFYLVRLETIVTNTAVYYKWAPFFRKYSVIAVDDIQTASMEKWPYMSWGYSRNAKMGRSHTVNGSKGVAIELKDGKKFYFGSQEPLNLVTTIERAMRPDKAGYR